MTVPQAPPATTTRRRSEPARWARTRLPKALPTAAGVAVVAVALFYASDLALNAWRLSRLPKNFSAVRPGTLYRSGQMRPEHFQQVIQDHGIETVVCLNPDPEGFEPALAAALGAEYVAYDMPGSGRGEPAFFHELLGRLAASDGPVLVHCAAGAYRTGATVALYRMVFEGWSLEDAVPEMKYSGFAGQQDLIDHVRATYDAIPPETLRAWRLDRATPAPAGTGSPIPPAPAVTTGGEALVR